MKNRFCALNAVTAGFILSSLTAAAAQGVPCPVVFLGASEGSAPSQEACASMAAYLPLFKTLLRAAAFEETEIMLVGRVNPADNASYYYDSKTVALNTGKIAKYPTPGPELLFTLAHEIGHAVQDRGGEEAWARSVPRGGEEELKRSRVIESHADAIAADLLERTGLADRKAIVEAQEIRFSCPAIQGGPTPPGTHPAVKDRFLHQLRRATLTGPAAQAAASAGPLDEQGLAGVFDRARRRLAAPFQAPVLARDGYRPPMTVDDFDTWGRPKTQGLRTAGVPRPPTPAKVGAAPPGFLAKLANAAAAAKDAAFEAVADAVWFDNPVIEDIAVKSCGIPKGAGFNEAVKAGALPWMAAKAAAAAGAVKDFYAQAAAQTVDLAFRPPRR